MTPNDWPDRPPVTNTPEQQQAALDRLEKEFGPWPEKPF